MNCPQLRTSTKPTTSLAFTRLGIACFVMSAAFMIFDRTPSAMASETVNPLTREFVIKVDPTTLTPPTWWQVPGVTPLIWSMDPVSTDALPTSEARELRLKPGKYQFGTFTFNFVFKVTLSGTLEYAKTLDQCVDGRGTSNLTIRCSHTQPYPQEPDYHDSQN